ncbi:D-alanine--D-alanine ligase [Advenella sp. S44]|uniref:D-alanine--D-alanine ligase n=1 Tax=Advenella sp. S44 TaxID=1982755 RepID=UPI000C2A61E0|nr:D-alanine--D-alanine ligase [Advenella sp. S44]PJX22443.1 D-alanine--D-alanine ligase [Advenella sp. S44]
MKNDFGKVGVLYGGRSAERAVSLVSGKGVYEALLSKGIDAHLFDTAEHSLAELATAGFDRVFIALHGRYGEDGSLQGALELLRIPYTGSGVMASGLAMDKIMTKRIWNEQTIPTAPYCMVRSRQDMDLAAKTLGYPFILKAPHEGSTLGLSKVTGAHELSAAFDDVHQFDSELLAEKFIAGRELTVAILGKGDDARAYPIIEIVAPDGKYDFEHKYVSEETQYHCPADLPQALAASIRQTCEKAFVAVGCEGWGRVDVMLDKDHRYFLLEVNTSPGMTPHSLVPMGAKAEGVSYADLCVQILVQASCKIQPTSAVAEPQL